MDGSGIVTNHFFSFVSLNSLDLIASLFIVLCPFFFLIISACTLFFFFLTSKMGSLSLLLMLIVLHPNAPSLSLSLSLPQLFASEQQLIAHASIHGVPRSNSCFLFFFFFFFSYLLVHSSKQWRCFVTLFFPPVCVCVSFFSFNSHLTHFFFITWLFPVRIDRRK